MKRAASASDAEGRVAGAASAGTALLLLLVVLTALGPTAMQIFIPALPAVRDAFATSTAIVQLTFSLSTLAMAASTLVAGSLADRFGRRPVILGGLGFFLLGTLIALFATSIPLLVLGRTVQAAGGATGFVLTRTIVRDLFGREDTARIIAYLTMGMVVAPMLAPALGGLLTDLYGWRSVFLVGGAAGLVVLAAVLRHLPETHRFERAAEGPRAMLASMARLLRIRAFQGYAITGAFSMSLFFSFLGGAPFVTVEVLERPASEYGLFFMLVSLAFMLGNFLAARVSARIGLDRMIRAGSSVVLIVATLAIPIMALGGWNLVTLFAPMTIIGFAQGTALPNVQAGAISVDPRAAGAASGLAGFIQMAMAALAVQIVGTIQDGTPYPTLLAMLVCAIGMVGGSLWTRSARA